MSCSIVQTCSSSSILARLMVTPEIPCLWPLHLFDVVQAPAPHLCTDKLSASKEGFPRVPRLGDFLFASGWLPLPTNLISGLVRMPASAWPPKAGSLPPAPDCGLLTTAQWDWLHVPTGRGPWRLTDLVQPGAQDELLTVEWHVEKFRWPERWTFPAWLCSGGDGTSPSGCTGHRD